MSNVSRLLLHAGKPDVSEKLCFGSQSTSNGVQEEQIERHEIFSHKDAMAAMMSSTRRSFAIFEGGNEAENREGGMRVPRDPASERKTGKRDRV